MILWLVIKNVLFWSFLTDVDMTILVIIILNVATSSEYKMTLCMTHLNCYCCFVNSAFEYSAY